MAEIEIGPLSDRLADDEIAELAKALAKVGAKLPGADDGLAATIADGVDDDVLAEFLDRLDAHDIACEIYLPTEFEDRLEVGEFRVGSAASLLEVLDELKDDLAIAQEDEDEDEDDDEEEEERELDLIEGQLRRVWKMFYAGAEAALERHLPMYVTPA